MTEELPSHPILLEQQPARPIRTLQALLRFYAEGHRNFSGSDLRGITVDDIDKEVKYLDLREVILKGSNLKGIVLCKYELKVDLCGANLSNCNLQGANLSKCQLDQCDFSGSDLKKANLDEVSCRGSDFIKAHLQNIRSSNTSNFTASNFAKANLSSASLHGSFFHANFRMSNLQKAYFSGYDAQGVDFSDANLQDLQLDSKPNLKYSYYNKNTKFSENFDPIAAGMELIEEESEIQD